MKLVSRFLIIATAIFSLFLVSCSKEMSFEIDSDQLYANKSWQFLDTAVQFKGLASFYEYDQLAGTMSYSGQTESGTEFIAIDLKAPNLGKGIYSSKKGEVTFSYKKQGLELYAADNIDSVGEELIVTIVAIDSNNVYGTFSGTVRTVMGDVIPVKEGKFLYTTIVTPVDPGNSTNLHFNYKENGISIDSVVDLSATKVVASPVTAYNILAQSNNGDTYEIAIAFNNGDINTSTTYNTNSSTAYTLAFLVNNSNGNFSASAIHPESSLNLKFSKYDKTNKLIAGTFSGTLVDGANKLVITEGSFQTNYTE